ncbi:MAG: response regulator [Pirellulaceae bacterium]
MSIREDVPETRHLNVLVAEDSPLHRRHTVWLLEAAGHRVIVVNNGREVLEVLPQNRFDVVLMDVEMPEIDGLTATRMIREQEDNGRPRLPIIAVTSTESQEACFSAGMDAFLPKPLEPESLKSTLENLLARTAA